MVEAERMRFDFSHFEPVSKQQIAELERQINAQIRANIELSTQLMNIEDAKQAGAMALFGEKYDDDVRVVRMGDVSMELCGGTHVRATGDIGLFRIINETGIASGVRRIEVVTGAAAVDYTLGQQRLLDQLAADLKPTTNRFRRKWHSCSRAQRNWSGRKNSCSKNLRNKPVVV